MQPLGALLISRARYGNPIGARIGRANHRRWARRFTRPSKQNSAAVRRGALFERHVAVLLTFLGHVRLDEAQPDAAIEAFAEAMRRARDASEPVWLVQAMEGMARWLALSDAHAAVRLAGAMARQRRVIGSGPLLSEQRCQDAWMAEARRGLGSDAFQRAWDRGVASTLAQAISFAEAAAARASAMAECALTPREWDVADLLTRGLTNKQIAAELVVSPGTVRGYVEHILTKLDFRSRAQIAVWASQQRLVRAGGRSE
jgi:non-specific serine/threonine protein kinase